MNLDDDGGSIRTAKSPGGPWSMRSRTGAGDDYIDDATDPEWDRAFNFIVPSRTPMT